MFGTKRGKSNFFSSSSSSFSLELASKHEFIREEEEEEEKSIAGRALRLVQKGEEGVKKVHVILPGLMSE